MLSVTVIYQSPLGVPAVLTQLTDEESVRQVVNRAISIMWSQAASLEAAGDPQLAEIQRLEATRLDAVIAALLPPRPEPAPTAPQCDDADPTVVM